MSIIVSLQHSHHQIITSRIELKYVQFKCYASYRQGPVLVVQAHVGAVGRGDEHRGVGGQGQDGHRALVAPVETSPAQQNILSEMVCTVCTSYTLSHTVYPTGNTYGIDVFGPLIPSGQCTYPP